MCRSPLVQVGLLLATCSAIAATPAGAFVVATTRENTTPPPDDPGWANVGVLNGSTGVYLGNRWVLTAFHVGAGTVLFPELGQSFPHDPTSVIRLDNPPGQNLSPQTDLVLFQLQQEPSLPPLRLAVDTPPAGAEVMAIGRGKDRELDPTYWDVVKGTKWTWTETEPPGDYSGYKTLTTNTLRWGNNLIEDDEPFKSERDANITTNVDSSFGDFVSLITEFDGFDGNSNNSIKGPAGTAALDFESQAVVNDSGGGLFWKNHGVWELVGTALAVEGYKDQPSETRISMFGNLTFYADLSVYLDQIETRYRLGDFDGDAQLTVTDIDALTQVTVSGTYQPAFDLNRDQQLDDQDRWIWVGDLRDTYFGDVNLDGLFDSDDLILAMQAGQYEDNVTDNSSWAAGDWDGDLEFRSSDFVLAFQSGGYEQGPRTSFRTQGAIVPEPAGPAWFLMGAVPLLLGCRRWYRRHAAGFLGAASLDGHFAQRTDLLTFALPSPFYVSAHTLAGNCFFAWFDDT